MTDEEKEIIRLFSEITGVRVDVENDEDRKVYPAFVMRKEILEFAHELIFRAKNWE